MTSPKATTITCRPRSSKLRRPDFRSYHGPHIPLIVVSPYTNAHIVSHESGDHNSIIRFIDELYGLPFLADLPDEAQARATAKATFGQANLGPDDDGVPFNSDLLSAFDYGRLAGAVAPLDAAYARVPESLYKSVPPSANHGCAAIGVIPDDAACGIRTVIPSDFNPRPSTDPTVTTAAATRRRVYAHEHPSKDAQLRVFRWEARSCLLQRRSADRFSQK